MNVLRAGVTCAVERGAQFVAPSHLLLGLLADPLIGPAIAPLVPRDKIEKAAADAAAKPADLDGESLRLFVEGARRAVDVYRAKHLVYGFTAEAVKDRDLLSLFGADPQ